MKQKNKYTLYILVTVAYTVAVLFILAGEPTTVFERAHIVWFWVLAMYCTGMYENVKKL